MIKKFMGFSLAKKALFALMAFVIIILLILVLKKTNGQVETISIKTGDFINQVSVSGKVIPSENVDLGFYQSGRIASIRVKVGDSIGRGTVVASLDNADLGAALAQRQAGLLREEAKLASLRAGTRPEQLAITESSVVSAQTTLDQATESLKNSIGDAYTKSDDAVKNKIDQFFDNPNGSNPSIKIFINDQDLISKINSDRRAITTILSTWKVSIATIGMDGDIEKYRKEAEGNLSKMKSFLDEVSSIVNNPSSTYNVSLVPATWKSDTSLARSNIETAISSLTSSVTSYRSAQTALVTMKSNLKLAEAGATAEDIAAQEAQVKSAEADVLNAKALLGKTIIVAPFDGVITRMDAKIGQITSPGESLISMMSAGTFQIESFVPEVNISKIKLGDEADITLDAYGEEVPFHARVILIDPAETVRNGVSTYRIKLQFEDKDNRIKSGMTANVSVIIEKKQNTIVIPEGTIYERGDKSFVETMLNGKISEKEITIGAKSSLGQVEVISGLVVGDNIVLLPKTN